MLNLRPPQLSSLETSPRDEFRRRLVDELQTRRPRLARQQGAARWRRSIDQAESEAWSEGLCEAEPLRAYVEARLVLGARPWPEDLERWLRPGEAAPPIAAARFVETAHARLNST